MGGEQPIATKLLLLIAVSDGRSSINSPKLTAGANISRRRYKRDATHWRCWSQGRIQTLVRRGGRHHRSCWLSRRPYPVRAEISWTVDRQPGPAAAHRPEGQLTRLQQMERFLTIAGGRASVVYWCARYDGWLTVHIQLYLSEQVTIARLLAGSVSTCSACRTAGLHRGRIGWQWWAASGGAETTEVAAGGARTDIYSSLQTHQSSQHRWSLVHMQTNLLS